jgi:hypothetical protein
MNNMNFEQMAYRHKHRMRKKFIFIPFIVLAMLALASYVVMLLWNNLIPDIFHVTAISYWQAAGLLVLCKILFGFGGPRGRGGAPWMRHKMERFKNMSPEEQQRFREEMRARCGKWGRHRAGFDWDSPAPEETSKPA